MRLLLLHIDDALEPQHDFVCACNKAGAEMIWIAEEARAIRLWGTHHNLNHFYKILAKQIAAGKTDPSLTFMGSGDFRHVTTYLVSFALKKVSVPITIIDFANYPGWLNLKQGLHCRSWINHALTYPQVEKIITLGVCSQDLRRPERKGANLNLLSKGLLELYPYERSASRVRGDYGSGPSHEQKKGALYWKPIRSLGERNFVDFLLSRIHTRAVYLTINKDVLALDDAITNWHQGVMRVPYLLSLIQGIGRHHSLIGAEVTGDYSTPRYSGHLWTRFSKRAEVFLHQPRGKPDMARAININSSANHALLEILSEVMP